MPPVNMLIKPASSLCNMRCRYCFYHDESDKREIKSYGVMSLDTLETLVKRALDYAEGKCFFAFQGGEPTLAGLDFYREFMKLVAKHNTRNIPCDFSIQTNGYLMDDEWAQFFRDNHFLVGLSLDGNKKVHDAYRFDVHGEGTYKKVFRAHQLLDKYGVDYNVLITVTNAVVKNIAEIYEFFRKNGMYYQQYIPCLDPIGEERGHHDYSLTPEGYGKFLITLFDLWYKDVMKGDGVSIRYFDNLLSMVAGYPPEACGMFGHCTFQNVIEADGSVYPCDFYVLDEYKLGNIVTDSFESINRKREESGFIKKSTYVDEDCRQCPYGWICRGGCRRDRDDFRSDTLRKNYLCPAFKKFFAHSLPGFRDILRKIQEDQMRGAMGR